MSIEGEHGGELVLLQATPFCNINCDYCYLPGRGERSRMSFETLRRTLEFVRAAGCVSGVHCLVWHVGEPLVVPWEWYREAHQLCSEVLGERRLELHFQTNGTLITRDWVELIRADPRIQLCVSIDGPAQMHDAHRRARNGGPTHARAMKGVGLLKEAGIPFDCIAVVTEQALDHPDDFYEFFRQLAPRMLSMNAESIDGAHRSSSVAGADAECRYRRFLRRIADLHLSERRFVIRNFLWAELKLKALQDGTGGSDCTEGNRLNRPWRILSFDWQGHVHTFSPSLLGMDLPRVGRWLGTVETDSYPKLAASERLLHLRDEIAQGVKRCRSECRHFAHCGGGSPAHKWYEHGSFDVSETTHCRLGVQANWDEYLAAAGALASP